MDKIFKTKKISYNFCGVMGGPAIGTGYPCGIYGGAKKIF